MDAVDEIKSKLDLVEYISRSSRLQKSGRNFRGLCPFHTEKTPSFYVFPERASWRCFGSCGEGGDLFSFVQKRDNLDFRGALRVLAADAGIQLSAESAQKRTRVEKLSAVLSAAVTYYQRCLAGPEGEAARAYLMEKRGLTPDTIESFHLGWAPDDWRLLHNHLQQRGYSETDMLGSGLFVEGENGRQPYDRFRGRVTIPIADARGQFVGMGGRGLQGEEPKYLNTPQSELFDKGGTLFGLDLASAAIREAGTVVVVEGYMDVMGPWQAGFRNVVATMGTSLTEHHAEALRRFARRIVLAMDPDTAGLAAAERAGALFIALDSPESMARSARSADAFASSAAIELRVAPLPAGKDPDEITREEPETWARAIAEAATYPEFLLRRLMGNAAPESPSAAREVVDRLKPVLNAVRDPVERALYVQRVARHLGIGEEAILERIRRPMPGGRGRRPESARVGPLSPEQTLLALLLRHPSLRADFRSHPPSLFNDAINREVFERWTVDDSVLLGESDDPVVAYATALAARRLPPLSRAEAQRAARAKLQEILRERISQHQAAITEELAEAERTVGANKLSAMATEIWHGALPDEDLAAMAGAAMETWQLGVSIHRREEPGRL
ncbi:MAG TPA: DNA primase [Tepidiformaceae bacterium]|nr:DNA primase [Tepidiformaceae bacterium]